MSILDSNSDDLMTAAVNSRWSPSKPVAPSGFDNFGSTAGNYFMRGMAEMGRSASMAVAAIPVALDKVVGNDNMTGKSLSDRYFEFHDETFGRAVDYWTPKPDETNKAGQVVGSLGAGIVQFLASPAATVANAQLSTSENLVRQGVSSDAALLAGDIAGLGTVAGIALPILGKNLTQRVATGVAGNLGQSVATASITQQIIKADGGSNEVMSQFDPFDPTGRLVDVLMGAVFGAKAHLDARVADIPATERDALLVLNQSRHMEAVSVPGRIATESDFIKAVDNTRAAIDQLVRGEPVSVPHSIAVEPDPSMMARQSELQGMLEEAMPPEQVQRPRMMDAIEPKVTQADGPAGTTKATEAQPMFDESVRLPTGEFDPKTGEETTVPANELIARANDHASQTKSTAQNVMMAAAECLLGSI